MIDVHLIGYTADLEHLVLDLDGGAAGRYRLLVDADLFATLDELRDERRAAGLPVGDLSEFLDPEQLAALQDEDAEDEPELAVEAEEDADEPDVRAEEASADDWSEDASGDDWSDDAVAQDDEADLLAEVEADRLDAEAEAQRISDNVRLVSPPPRVEAAVEDEPVDDELEEIVDEDVSDEESEDVSDDDAELDAVEVEEPAAADPREAFADAAQPSRRPNAEVDRPKLSPAQIQGMLRAGKSPRSVAREAGTDVTWIERWLPPILAERTRILERAHAKRLERSRLGPSRDPLGAAVERNLKAKGLGEGDITWEVGRRNDGRWKVTVKYAQRGKNRSATWTYDPTDDELRSASETARELGYTRAKRTTSTSSSKRAKKPAARKPAEKPAPKRSTAKKPAPKRSTAKKPAAKKAPETSAARRSTAKKTTSEEPTSEKSTPEKSAAKKTAKKSTAKKSTAKKTARKSTAEKSTAKKTAKKSTAEKSAAKKTAAKKSTAKKSTAKKSAAKKSPAKRSTAKRSTPEKPAAKRTPGASSKRTPPAPQKATPVLPPELRGNPEWTSSAVNGSRPASAERSAAGSPRTTSDVDR